MIIKKNNQVTITDITDEAKEVLSTMCGYNKEAYEKKAFLRERKWYWMDLGKNELEALQLSKKDVEFAY